jgi:hypothetical protein
MWRQFVLAGTVTAVLFTGAAFAFASQGAPGAPASESAVELDHWSQMAIEMGDQWPAMVNHMEARFGDRFPEMVKEMQLLGPETHGSGMGGFMDGSGTGCFMDESGMGDFMDGFGMGDFMDGFGMGGHMDGSGMGGFGTDG